MAKPDVASLRNDTPGIFEDKDLIHLNGAGRLSIYDIFLYKVIFQLALNLHIFLLTCDDMALILRKGSHCAIYRCVDGDSSHT